MYNIIPVLVLSLIYFLMILWLHKEQTATTTKQRKMIIELIDENQGLKARLRLHGIESNENK